MSNISRKQTKGSSTEDTLIVQKLNFPFLYINVRFFNVVNGVLWIEHFIQYKS